MGNRLMRANELGWDVSTLSGSHFNWLLNCFKKYFDYYVKKRLSAKWTLSDNSNINNIIN